ncbi:MAG: NAD(P)H-dependent glycerol-3-phosphate dehydrogenase [candidate division WOR-3 bacterium]|nr:NAD(P)H-dependent glycerol-3-phosphate dehydrogenase [candidate division WOR-3 bacterium]
MDNLSIGIVGAGNWGTTLALYINRKSIKVILYEYFRERTERLRLERENKEFLPGYRISEDIVITNEPEELVKNSTSIFFVLPSHALKNVLSLFSEYINDEIICSFIKGIDPDTLQRMSQVLEEKIPQAKNKVVVVSGPSIAREVAKGIPTSLVAASRDIKRAEIVQKILSGEKMRVYTSSDIVGVELGGSLKNVYAIASGICDGMELGMNAKAALITRSMAELKRLGIKMKGESETFAGLSGFGDLIATSFSPYSRNRTVGERLGRGEGLNEILDDMVEVAEGVRTTKSTCKLSDRYNIEMPIAREVFSVLFENKNPRTSIGDLMQRDLKREKR